MEVTWGMNRPCLGKDGLSMSLSPPPAPKENFIQREGQLLAVEGKLRRQQLDALILVGLRRVGPATGVLEGGRGCSHAGAGVSWRPQSPGEEPPGVPGPS